MGMYTEIYVNVDLKEDTPAHVIDVLRAMCEKDNDSPHLADKPERWACLFSSGSCYTPNTECGLLTKDDFASEQYSLLAKGDIKNYEGEIEQFFEFIKPWCKNDFIGYRRYEEDVEPTLVYSTDFV